MALHVRDPHEQGTWGICPTKFLFGFDCPGCGGLRAVNDLTHGDVVGAASSNLLFVVSVPFLLVAWLLWLRRASRGERWQPGRRASLWAWSALAVLMVFVVVRNLPGSWLAA